MQFDSKTICEINAFIAAAEARGESPPERENWARAQNIESINGDGTESDPPGVINIRALALKLLASQTQKGAEE